MHFYEDVQVGDTHELGSYRVTKEEIVDFAEQFDPQPFHLDEAAAEESVFGRLVASGWHTASLTMRLLVQGREDLATIAGVGVDDLRWHAPLAAGDELSARAEVVDKRPDEKRDERGYVTTRIVGHNQDGERIISYDAIALVKRREG